MADAAPAPVTDKDPANPNPQAPVAAATPAPVAKPDPTPSVLSDPAKEPAKPAPEPVGDFPADWREKLSAGDAKKLERLKRYGSPTALTDALISAQDKIRSGEYKKGLPENATEAEVTEWRKENGIPEKPDGYLEGLPQGVVIGEDDKKLVGIFAEDMHKANTPPATVHAAIQSYYKIQEEVVAERQQLDAQVRQESTDKLNVEWGADFRRNINAIKALLDTAPQGVKDEILNARLMDGTPLASKPEVLKFLLSTALEINPAMTVVPAAGASAGRGIQDRLDELTKMMGDRKSDYWKGPSADKLQAEYRDLIDAKRKMDSRAA